MAKEKLDKKAEIDVARFIFLNNIDPRRRAEAIDSELVQEDKTKHANLPEEFIYGKFHQEYY